MTDRRTELWAAYRADRSQANRNALVVEHLMLAYSIANRYATSIEGVVAADDLRQEALAALCEIVDRFDPGRDAGNVGRLFTVYARRSISGRVIDVIRRETGRRRKVRPVRVELGARRNVRVADGPADTLERAETIRELHAGLAALPARDRQIMGWLYDDQLSMTAAGARLGVTASRVSQIHTLAIGRLRSTLGEAA